MIAVILRDEDIEREDDDSYDKYVRTFFLADTVDDITAMNTSGSEYLEYPAGSMVYCVANNKRYILKADCSAYAEI